jgi:hypothetical protein
MFLKIKEDLHKILPEWILKSHLLRVLTGFTNFWPLPIFENFWFKKHFNNCLDLSDLSILNSSAPKSDAIKIGKTVWMLLLSGEKSANKIEKSCINQARKFSKEAGYKFIIITKCNWEDYISFPKEIQNLVRNDLLRHKNLDKKTGIESEIKNNNQLTVYSYTDMISQYILAKYGGLMITSTIFFRETQKVKNPIEYILSQKFYTPSYKEILPKGEYGKNKNNMMALMASNCAFSPLFVIVYKIFVEAFKLYIPQFNKNQFKRGNKTLSVFFIQRAIDFTIKASLPAKGDILESSSLIFQKDFFWFYRLIFDKFDFPEFSITEDQFNKKFINEFVFKLDRKNEINEFIDKKKELPTAIHWIYKEGGVIE